MSSSSTNNAKKWEQKYIKYKIKYNTIKKELASLIGGSSFIPVYNKCYELCIDYELTDNNLFQAITKTSSFIDDKQYAYDWMKLSKMYISLLDLYFNSEHKAYKDFLTSNKQGLPSIEEITSKLDKCIKDKFNGLQLLNNKDKPQFESSGDQDLFLSACFKLSGNPSQVFNQMVDCVVKVFSMGKGFDKREYNVNGKKIVGLFIDNIEFACYQKFYEETSDCIDIRVASMNLEDYYDNIIDNTELKIKINKDIIDVIQLNKIPVIPAPNSNITSIFKTVVTLDDNFLGTNIQTPSIKTSVQSNTTIKTPPVPQPRNTTPVPVPHAADTTPHEKFLGIF